MKSIYNYIQTNRSRTLFHLLLIIVLTTFVFLNTLSNKYAYDDDTFLTNWQSIKSVKNVSLLLQGDLPEGHRGVYRPVRSILYSMSYSVWQDQIWGYHLQAIFIHVLVTLVIYGIVLEITKKKGLSLLTALLFGLHPIHTEAVSFTTASFDTIGIFFFFLSFYFYLKAQNSKSKQAIFYFGSLLYGMFAFFTYEMTLVLPLLLVLYDFAQKKLTRKTFFGKSKIYVCFFLLIIFYIFIRVGILNIKSRADMTATFFTVAKGSRLFSFDILFYYLEKLLIPTNLTIVPTTGRVVRDIIAWLIRYPMLRDIIDSIYFSYAVAITTFILPLLGVGLGIIKSKSFSIILFSIGWFFICLLSVANFTPQGSPIAERFLYIPSFGFCLLLAYVLSQIYHSKRVQKLKLQTGVIILIIGLLIFYGFQTYQRNKDWYDQITIWESALKIHPDHLIGLNNLGVSYAKAGKIEKAIDIFRAMLNKNPNNKEVRYNYSIALMNTGQTEQAKVELAKFPKNATFIESENLTLANIYSQLENYPKALEHLKNYQAKKPENEGIFYNLAILYVLNNQFEEAENSYKKAIELNPNFIQADFNLASLYQKQNQSQKAIDQFKKVLEKDPKNIHAHYKLGILYFEQGAYQSAKAEFETVKQVDANYEKVSEYLNQIP